MPVYGFLASFGARRFPKGNEGKRVSSGYNRRRRLATRSSGKQQAERTAVRTAPIVCPEESPLVRPQAHTPARGWGLTRRLRRGWWGCRPEGAVLSFEAKESTKESTAARRLQRRPTSLCAVGFGLREPFGLSSASARCAHPPGKSPLLPIFERGSSQCRAQHSWIAIHQLSCALVLTLFLFQKGQGFFPPLPIAALLRRHLGEGEGQVARVGMLPRGVAAFARQKAKVVFKSRWPVARATRACPPRWRSAYANKQETTPDRRAARPVAERRPWGRKRRKREALCRVFPKRHTYLYSPRAKGAEWGAGALPLPARRFFLWMGI